MTKRIALITLVFSLVVFLMSLPAGSAQNGALQATVIPAASRALGVITPSCASAK